MKKVLKRFIYKLFGFFKLCKIQNDKIIFINFNGKGFGDNPKYIASKLYEKKMNYRMIWFVKDNNVFVPDYIKKVRYNSISYWYHLYTSHFIVTNVQNGFDFDKRKGQCIMETWHASYTLKLLENDAEGKLSAEYLRISNKNTKQSDLFISNSKLQSEEYRKSFRYTGEILESGYPRNDIFFKDNTKLIKKIKKELNIENKYVIFYTPTFRDDNSIKGYNINLNMVINSVKEKKLSSNIVVLVRMHPNVKDYKKLFDFSSQIIDVTSYPDGQELLLISDMLITDYSTTMFDFMIFNSNIFIYASDLDEYNKMRGLKPFMKELPFKICHNNQELEKEILSRNTIEFEKKMSKFKNKYKSYDHGNATDKIVEYIENHNN